MSSDLSEREKELLTLVAKQREYQYRLVIEQAALRLTPPPPENNWHSENGLFLPDGRPI